MTKEIKPGVSREQRLSDEGLLRLEKQFQSGVNVNAMVLKQWIKRYGEAARNLIKKHDRYSPDLED